MADATNKNELLQEDLLGTFMVDEILNSVGNASDSELARTLAQFKALTRKEYAEKICSRPLPVQEQLAESLVERYGDNHYLQVYELTAKLSQLFFDDAPDEAVLEDTELHFFVYLMAAIIKRQNEGIIQKLRDMLLQPEETWEIDDKFETFGFNYPINEHFYSKTRGLLSATRKNYFVMSVYFRALGMKDPESEEGKKIIRLVSIVPMSMKSTFELQTVLQQDGSEHLIMKDGTLLARFSILPSEDNSLGAKDEAFMSCHKNPILVAASTIGLAAVGIFTASACLSPGAAAGMVLGFAAILALPIVREVCLGLIALAFIVLLAVAAYHLDLQLKQHDRDRAASPQPN